MKKLKFILQKFNYVFIFFSVALIVMFYVTACIKNTQPAQTSKEAAISDESVELESYYVGNIISKRFHRPDCEQLPSEKNQEIIVYREDALAAGYIPCGSCNP